MENKVYVLFYTSLIIYGITIKATASKYFQKLYLHRDTLFPNCTLHVFFQREGQQKAPLGLKLLHRLVSSQITMIDYYYVLVCIIQYTVYVGW